MNDTPEFPSDMSRVEAWQRNKVILLAALKTAGATEAT